MPKNLNTPVYATNIAQKVGKKEIDFMLGPYVRMTSTSSTACNTIVNPYSGYMALPAAVVIHPYNPNENDAYDFGLTKTFAAFSLHPANATALQQELGVTEVKINVVMQSNPWVKGQKLLLRPHPWAHSTAPSNQPAGQTVEFSQHSDLEVSIYADANYVQHLGIQRASTHASMNVADKPVVYSWINMGIEKQLTDPDETQCLYSICIDRARNRAAITLHTLLCQRDAIAMEQACRDMPADCNLGVFLDRIQALNTLGFTKAVTNIRELSAGHTPKLLPLTEVVKFLSKNGFDTTLRELDRFHTVNFHTPLTKAVDMNLPAIYTDLVDVHGASVNAKSSFGNTPLHIAADKNNIEAALWLLGKNPDCTIKNTFNRTALEIAQEKGHWRIYCIIALHQGRFSTDPATVNNFNSTYHTPLTYAVKNRMPDLVTALVKEFGANVNARNGVGNTALHLALHCRNEPMVTMLLALGARIDIANDQGITAETLAREVGIALPTSTAATGISARLVS